MLRALLNSFVNDLLKFLVGAVILAAGGAALLTWLENKKQWLGRLLMVWFGFFTAIMIILAAIAVMAVMQEGRIGIDRSDLRAALENLVSSTGASHVPAEDPNSEFVIRVTLMNQQMLDIDKPKRQDIIRMVMFVSLSGKLLERIRKMTEAEFIRFKRQVLIDVSSAGMAPSLVEDQKKSTERQLVVGFLERIPVKEATDMLVVNAIQKLEASSILTVLSIDKILDVDDSGNPLPKK